MLFCFCACFLWTYQREYQKFYTGQSNNRDLCPPDADKNVRESHMGKINIEGWLWKQQSLGLRCSALPAQHRCAPHEQTASGARSLPSFHGCPKVNKCVEPLRVYVVLFTASRLFFGFFFKAFRGGKLAVFPPAKGLYFSRIKTVSLSASLWRIWKHSCFRGGVITPQLGRRPVLCCINVEVAELSSFGRLPQPLFGLPKKI